MENFRDLKEMSAYIKEIRMNNLNNWQMNQKLYEIEQFILNSEEDYSICDNCSYNGNDYNEDDLKEEHEDGYEEGMNETLEAIQKYVERRLKHE